MKVLTIDKLISNYTLITANTNMINKTVGSNIQQDPRRTQHIITNSCDIFQLTQARPMMLCIYTSRHACKHMEGYDTASCTLGRILTTENCRPG